MKALYCIPLVLLLTIAGDVDGQWTLAPKAKIAERPVVRQASSVSRSDLPPTPQPTPAPTITLQPAYNSSMGVVLLKAECSSDVMLDGLLWESPDEVTFHNDFVEMKPGCIFATVSKSTKIRAIGAVDNRPCISNWCIITVMGPQPPPGPGPQPVPPGPSPGPVVTKAAKLKIYTIDDLKTRTKPRTDALSSSYYIALRKKGHVVEQFNVTREDVMKVCAPMLAANGGTGTPIIIIQNADTNAWINTTPVDLKLPMDDASLKALVAKYTDNLP